MCVEECLDLDISKIKKVSLKMDKNVIFFWISFSRGRSMAMVVERTLNLDLNSNLHFMVEAAF